MFYSEALLSKTGPLARIWLSANFGERKVPKKDVLHQNIGEGVNAIIDQAQAPLALRLNGHLLLGVVKIYSRKTRYLLDDCNEAILKIKMAFRPGNVDLPSFQSHAANPASLTLPDVLTELDLLAPLPDPSLLDNPEEFTISQRLANSMDRSRAGSVDISRLDNSGFGDEFLTPRSRRERDIEFGRDAPPSRDLRDDFEDTLRPGEGEDLILDFGETADMPGQDSTIMPPIDEQDNDINMGGLDDDLGLNINGDASAPDAVATRVESSAAPIGRESAERQAPNEQSTILYEPSQEPEEESLHLPQRAKRRKVLQADADTEMHSAQIKQQQLNRSKILKPASFLPRDPMLLALMDMHKNGGFVSSILGDGSSRGWAPELRGILSLEVVRKSGSKRKRSTIAEGAREQPEIEGHYQDEDLPALPGSDLNAERDFHSDRRNIDDVPAFSDTLMPQNMDDADETLDQTYGFDRTEAPLVHPNESGPVSVGTKHAVHLLRDRFGADAQTSPNKRQQSSIVFQDLLPERSTTRADATKMFFEMLVLATKDAIKVEQPIDELGGPLRVRARRGLWGTWAETSAGGEIATQEPLPVA